MRKLVLLVTFLMLMLSALSCAQAPTLQSNTGNAPSGAQGFPAVKPTIPQTTPSSPSAAAPSGSSQQPADIAARLIVRNGEMLVMVDNIKAAVDQIAQLAEQKKGFVVSSQVSPSGQGGTESITIRVPAEEFENTIKAITALAVELKSQSTSSRDVTQEYTDLNSRLTNLQATEQQYLKILEKATTIQEILDVQKELSNTRGQIEETKGQIQYLQQTSSTSQITVSLQQSKLMARIAVSRVVADVEQSISFSPDIAGGFTPLSYEWNFGDKSTSTETNPTHSYVSTGNFNVTLKVTDARGNSVTDKTNIVISGGWNGGSVARAAWRALLMFGKVVLNIVIWIGIFSPVWIIGGGLAILLRWWGKKKRQRGSPALSEAADSQPGSPAPTQDKTV